MSNTIMAFAFANQPVRTTTSDNGEILFLGKDVATALGYKNTRHAILKHCKDTRTLDVNTLVTKTADVEDPILGGKPSLEGKPLNPWSDPHNVPVWLTESDVYRLMMRSNLPAAEMFQDWVFNDVLPSIRKTGKYALPKKQLLLELEQKSLSGFEAFQKMTYSEQIAVYCALQDQKSPMVKYLVIDSYRDPIYFTPSQMSKKLGYKRQADFTNDLLASGLIDEDYHLLTEKGFRHGEYRAGSLRWCATVADALRPVWDEHNEEMRRRTFVPSSR